MPKFNQQGIAQVLVLLLILAGIAAGVYLVGQRTNLLPKAYVSPSPFPSSFGKAIKISKKPQGVVIPITGDVIFGITIEGFFKLEGNQRDQTQYLIQRTVKNSKEDTSISIYSLKVNQTGENLSQIQLDVLNNDMVATDNILKDGKWHHIGAVIGDPSSENQFISLYIDGQLKASTKKKTNILPPSGDQFFYIGMNEYLEDLSKQQSLIGQIDEIRISSKIRYQNNFDLSLKPFPVDDDTLMLYHFDGNTKDSGSNSFGGEPIGSIEFSDSTIITAEGSPKSTPSPSACVPRPPCTLGEPDCQLQEPAEGWCPVIEIVDTDKDGFKDDIEKIIGTDYQDSCPDNSRDNAWPSDLNNDKIVNTRDESLLKRKIGRAQLYSKRYDLDGSGIIDNADLALLRIQFNKSCVN